MLRLIAFLSLVSVALVESDESNPAIEWSGDVLTAIQVSDLEKSATWYQRVFGFEVTFDLRTMGWMELSTPSKDASIGLGTPEPGKELQTNGGSKMSFGVKDLNAVRERLLKLGVEVPEVQVIPDTVKLLEFKDPDGNQLMLHQSLAQG